jgi:hypothetical protein
MKLTDNKLYKDNQELYDVLSDYVRELGQIPVEKTDPELTIDINLDDCILDDDGLFVPTSYVWKYKGSDPVDDPDEYSPMYLLDVNQAPNLSQDKILAMLHPEFVGTPSISNTNPF